MEQLGTLCTELREFIIHELASNPGHLASSLGAIETTVAMHYVYDTPSDRIVWDVGHQAYAHKILTGRREQFHTNRKLGGLRPFPSPKESDYDTFACGHASNSISAALGMAVAAKIGEGNGSSDSPRPHVVAFIGDGAMSGGLAFEGLNNVSSTPNDLLIILNDNDMSIDRAVGGMEKYLLSLSTSKRYNRVRLRFSNWMERLGVFNEKRKKTILRLNNALKSVLSRQQNIFEGMNIRYIGPVDGNNVKEMVRVLQIVKDMRGPKLLHIHTKKGCGYAPAEQDATTWHAPGTFDPETGTATEQNANAPVTTLRYQDVFGKTLLELARQNARIVGVTPAMPTGCSMNIMMRELPERCFDVGIAEGHAVTFSGGMAKEGLLPFCNIYSSFAQRAIDNIVHDVALLNLPVTICLDRAGLVGEDGATHHGALDMALLRVVPNLTICSPMDADDLRRMMFTAQQDGQGPWVIRYPRGKAQGKGTAALEAITPGTARLLHEATADNTDNAASADSLCVLTLGPLGNDIAELIAEHHLNIGHYDMRFVKPLDTATLDAIAERYDRVITIEDGARDGGFGSAVLEHYSNYEAARPRPRVTRLGLPDTFVEHGSVAELRKIVGLDKASLLEALTKRLKD